MKRVFIAVKVISNENTYEKLSSIRSNLHDEKIKWVDLANMHITLKFFGDTQEEKIPIINEAIVKNIENKFAGFSFLVKGLGVFKNIHNPRVLWLGIVNKDDLNALNDIIENSLYKIGFDKSDKKFSPHLTIGRIKYLKNRNKLKELLNVYNEYKFQEVKVDKLIIYESVLQKTGPVYSELYTIKLE